MNKRLRDLNEATERLFIAIEDLIARPIRWTTKTAAAWRQTGSAETAPARTGRQVDAELARDAYNPLRGWRWV